MSPTFARQLAAGLLLAALCTWLLLAAPALAMPAVGAFAVVLAMAGASCT